MRRVGLGWVGLVVVDFLGFDGPASLVRSHPLSPPPRGVTEVRVDNKKSLSFARLINYIASSLQNRDFSREEHMVPHDITSRTKRIVLIVFHSDGFGQRFANARQSNQVIVASLSAA